MTPAAHSKRIRLEQPPKQRHGQTSRAEPAEHQAKIAAHAARIAAELATLGLYCHANQTAKGREGRRA